MPCFLHPSASSFCLSLPCPPSFLSPLPSLLLSPFPTLPPPPFSLSCPAPSLLPLLLYLSSSFSPPSFPSFSFPHPYHEQVCTSLSFTSFGCGLWRLPFLLHPISGIYEGYCVWSQCLHFSLLCVGLLWELHHNSPDPFLQRWPFGLFPDTCVLCLRTDFVRSRCVYLDSEEQDCSGSLSMSPPGQG